jgi:CHAT domain-containing protein
VTATGSLSGIPPNVLVTEAPAAGQDSADPKVLAATSWFADRYALVSLPSVSVMQTLKGAPAKGQQLAFIGYGAPVLEGEKAKARAFLKPFKAADENGVTLADPDTLRTMSPLPGTARELAAMATTLKVANGNVLTGPRATERAIRADGNLPRARIIAFATHGVLPQEVSGIEEPGLVFTPPVEASGSDDGLLAASEVAKLSLSADWVLLSACNTASGDGTPGADSLSSLARSFLYAGASALLASHWRVSDDATARLTVETLSGRSGGGLSRAESLQRAMKTVRTGKRADGSALSGWDDGWAHPSYWGGFTVISNSGD